MVQFPAMSTSARDLQASGTRHQGWSAAAVIGVHCLQGKSLLRIDHD
jgi:hypothetical protein